RPFWRESRRMRGKELKRNTTVAAAIPLRQFFCDLFHQYAAANTTKPSGKSTAFVQYPAPRHAPKSANLHSVALSFNRISSAHVAKNQAATARSGARS